jgi:hypothetical protein
MALDKDETSDGSGGDDGDSCCCSVALFEWSVAPRMHSCPFRRVGQLSFRCSSLICFDHAWQGDGHLRTSLELIDRLIDSFLPQWKCVVSEDDEMVAAAGVYRIVSYRYRSHFF